MIRCRCYETASDISASPSTSSHTTWIAPRAVPGEPPCGLRTLYSSPDSSGTVTHRSRPGRGPSGAMQSVRPPSQQLGLDRPRGVRRPGPRLRGVLATLAMRSTSPRRSRYPPATLVRKTSMTTKSQPKPTARGKHRPSPLSTAPHLIPRSLNRHHDPPVDDHPTVPLPAPHTSTI